MTSAGQPAAAPAPAHPLITRVRRAAPAHPAYAWAATSAVRPISGLPAEDPGLLCCADLVLDETRWTVHRAGTPVELSPTEFRLLACLLRHQGQVLTRTQLLQHVWGRDYRGQPQVLETYVSYLRRKLGRLGPPLIRTRRGVGYTLRDPDAGIAADRPRLAPGGAMP